MLNKKIRLIETFAGYGSQAMALDELGIDYESHRISEWNISVNTSYNAVHSKDKTDYAKDLSDDEVYNRLERLGLTMDDKKIMCVADYKRRGIKWSRRVYNEFLQNRNLGSITKVTAEDLAIDEIDKYLYMLTYSFPCVDLSTAGKQQGMKKGSGTRSGLLWELERILKESTKAELHLPQILFMENVKQVLSVRNKPDFEAWCTFLESLGYVNSYTVLNSCEYGGIPQNRERCFMVSILGGPKYEFPDTVPLTTYLRDYLDDIVDNPRMYITNEYTQKVLEEHKGVDFFATTERYNNIVVLGNYMKSNFESSRIVNVNGLCPTVKDNHNTVTAIIDDTGRVRKLTVTEFGRLMGVSEENIQKMLSVQSASRVRKQFGNSIVVGVMVNIFGKLFNVSTK